MLKVKFRFRQGHRDSFTTNPPWTLKTLFLTLTDNCDHACHYCHNGPPGERTSLSWTLVERILDQAAEMDKPAIVLTGGEPFLYSRFEDVLKLCAERQLPCKIATNGVHLDEKRINLLLKHEVKSLQISLDTLDPSIYAKIRNVTPPIHRKVLEGISNGVAVGRLHMVVSAVDHQLTRPGLSDVLNYCHDNGLDTFTLYHIIPYKGTSSSVFRAEEEVVFLEVLERLFEEFSRLPQHWAVDLGFPWAKGSDLFLKWKDIFNINPVGCIAGKSSMTILASGDAVSCVCAHDGTFSCGNVATQSLSALWDAPAMKFFRGEIGIELCKGCPEFEFCREGCRTLAYQLTGKTNSPDPVCRYWKSVNQ